MKFSKTFIALNIAMSGLLFAAPNALAFGTPSAYAEVSLNVRSGPDTFYDVIDTLYEGEGVQTHQCTQGWCFISHAGPSGWVSNRYLREADIPGRTPSLPSYPIPIEPGPGGGPIFGPDPTEGPVSGPWPTPPIPWPFQPQPVQRVPNGPIPTEPEFQACVFAGNHYTGRSTCIISGRAFEQLGPRWNNQISSMRVYPGAQVTLCMDANYKGYCASYDQDAYSLDQRINSRASSLWVD